VGTFRERLRINMASWQVTSRKIGFVLWRLRGFAIAGLLSWTVILVVNSLKSSIEPNYLPVSVRDETGRLASQDGYGSEYRVRPNANPGDRSTSPGQIGRPIFESRQPTSQTTVPTSVFLVDKEGRMAIEPIATSPEADTLIEAAVLREFGDGHRDSAFKIVGAISDERQRTGALIKLLAQIRSVAAYQDVVSPQEYYAIDPQPKSWPSALRSARPLYSAATPPGDEAKGKLENDAESLKRAEESIIEAARAEVAKVSAIVSSLKDDESKAAAYFSLADTQRRLGSAPAAQESLDRGIAALQNTGTPSALFGLGLTTWLFGTWTVLFGMLTFFKDTINSMLLGRTRAKKKPARSHRSPSRDGQPAMMNPVSPK